MKTIFRTAFYLRSNYVNKDGKVPVMLRIYLNNERLSLGSTGIAILRSQWDSKKERVKGRSTEVLSLNLELDNIQNGLQNIFRRMEFNESLSLERIKMEFLGKKEDIGTIMELFDRHITDVKKQVGVSGLTHNPNYSPSSKSRRGLSLAKNICTRGIDLPSFAFRRCRMKRSILAMSSMFMAASPARLLQPSSPR